jgi:hypothetical protein
LTVIASIPMLAALVVAPAAASPDPSPEPDAAWASLRYEFSDFFGGPWAEYWDYRLALYSDLPFNAECFTQAAIDTGICVPANAAIPDVPSYPYMNWYPGVGAPSPGSPSANPWVQAPYRMHVAGVDVTSYTLAEPVYFPVLNPAQPAGTRLDFMWSMEYINRAEATALNAAGCPITADELDGYHARSIIRLTMDAQESRRLFGATGNTQAQLNSWWSSNTTPLCGTNGALESSVATWFQQMGGGILVVGKYDIYNGFEWFYQPFFTQITGTVAADLTTTVTIDHLAWGTEVLLSRFFYWGPAAYNVHYRDSRQALGWWGMENGWFEHLSFAGSFSAADHDFTLDTLMQYHLASYSFPGPDGMWDHSGDSSYWQWGATLIDYVNDFSSQHVLSELDRIPGKTYVRTAPGHNQYGSALGYDYTPVAWNLKAGETHVFRFPTGPIMFFDPNLTPEGADPRSGYIGTMAVPAVQTMRPVGYGLYDPPSNTLTLTGPTSTGGPAGYAGPDGTVGTADDDYALDPWPSIQLVPRPEPGFLRATTSPAVPGKILVDGIPRDEWGLTWVKLNPGPISVRFGDVYGLETPAAQAATIASGMTAEVPGNYIVHGSLRVTTEPALPGTIYVEGQPANDWGMWRSILPGTYTVSYGAVAGFTPPAPETVTIGAGAFRHLVGRYTSNPSAPGPDPATFGYLRVTTNPAVPSQISVNGIPRDEWGLTWVKVAPGMYTVSFKGVYGFTTPAAAAVTVVAGATAIHEGAFLLHGSLRILTSPALPATVYVDGLPRNDWGMWQSMPPGTYLVSFASVPGYVTPASQTVAVAAGALTTATGTYVVASAAAQPDAEPTALPATQPGPRIAVVASPSGRD